MAKAVLFLLSGAAIAITATRAAASETVSYGYDALGRLSSVGHAGSVNNGVAAAYQYDAADNRRSVTVTGSSAPPVAAIVIVPLRRLAPIAIPGN